MSYLNEIELIISDQIPKGNFVKGGVRFGGSSATGTLLGDFANKSKSELMTMFPFKDMVCEDVPSYTANGVLLNISDSFVFMPNCWRHDTSDDDGTEEHWVANYKVDDTWHKSYPGDFRRLGLSKFFAYEQNSYLHSITGVIPTVNMNQVNATNKMPYYHRGASYRRANYMDARVWRQYQIFCMIYLNCRNLQTIYQGMQYSYSKGIIADDITDTRSRYTGVTEESGSTGRLSHGVATGEITGTSSTPLLDASKRPFQILGIENPYGFLWTNIYGIMHNNQNLLIYKGTDPLASDKLNPSGGDSYTDVGAVLNPSEGWQKQVCDVDGYFYVKSVGGNSSAYDGDYYWYASGYKLFFVGGRWTHGAQAGLLAFHGRNDFGDAWTYIGFRLSLEL